MLCRLNHQHILNVISIIIFLGQPGLQMPYMQNGDLLSYVRREKVISLEVKMRFVNQIVLGM